MGASFLSKPAGTEAIGTTAIPPRSKLRIIITDNNETQRTNLIEKVVGCP